MSDAYRLVFDVEDDHITLTHIRRIAMRVPPSQTTAEMARPTSGRFVEVIGDQDRTLYRRPLEVQLNPHVEYPTGDPARPFGHAPAPRRREVVVLVPADPAARRALIVEVRARRPRGEATTSAVTVERRELASVTLPDAKEVL
jgi:hypothetical protein